VPFNPETAAAAGRKGGPNRWRDKDPTTTRSVGIHPKLTPDELEMIDSKAAEEGVSRVELIVRAVREYKPKKQLCRKN